MTAEQRKELVLQTQNLVDDCQRLRRELALAYDWKTEPQEVAPEGWTEEMQEKRLLKLFR